MYYIVSVIPRRVEAEHLLQSVQEFAARPLRDTDSAIALHVRVASYRNDACAGPTNISAQEQQIDDLLHVSGAADVLSNPHAIAGHYTVGLQVDARRLFELLARETRLPLDRRPRRCPQVCAQFLEPVRVTFDEVDIQYARSILAKGKIVGLYSSLHHSLECSHVTANLHLVIVCGDPRRSVGRHFEQSLRGLKAFERPLPQRVEDDDACTTARGIVLFGHHPRAVGARVLSDDENQIGVVEVLKQASPLANSNR